MSDDNNNEENIYNNTNEAGRLLERTERIKRAICAEVDKENELVAVVERLRQSVEANASKREKDDASMERRIEMDSTRSGNAKQLHEELTEQFMEFCKWHFVEPRFNIVWRAFNKLGLYLRVFLSFIFVVPFIAIYSKALRFFRRRIRGRIRKKKNNNNIIQRPAWITLQRHRSFNNNSNNSGARSNGLAHLVSNPLAFSGTSLRDELESMGNFSSDNSDTEELRRFVVATTTTTASDVDINNSNNRGTGGAAARKKRDTQAVEQMDESNNNNTPTTSQLNTSPQSIATSNNNNTTTTITTPTLTTTHTTTMRVAATTTTTINDNTAAPDGEPATRTDGTGAKRKRKGNKEYKKNKNGIDKRDDKHNSSTATSADGDNDDGTNINSTRSRMVDVPGVTDGEEQRASWASEEGQDTAWVDKDSQNSRDFWDSFGVRSRRSSSS